MKKNIQISVLKQRSARRMLWICALFLLSSVYAQAQIRGKVTDDKGEALIGVAVKVVKTNTGTSTDLSGEFSLPTVPADAVLELSYVGYESQLVPVRGRNFIAVVLKEDTKALDEVVVVGYGTQKRTSVTGSIAQVEGKELMKIPVSNLSQMLGGRVSGITSHQSSGQPGSDDASLMVRGFSTTSNNAPIILVDGIQRTYNQLDPNEIQSITILKDASAAAVYGMQAANGVILVTTKRGLEQKPKVTYSASMAANQNTAFPQFMNGPQYAYYYNKALELDGKPVIFTEQDVNKMLNGDPEGVFGNTNWIDEIFRTGYTHHHNLSISGGNDAVKYYVMGGYYKQIGNVERFNFDRYNIRSNIDAKINQNLSVSLDLGARREERRAPAIGMGRAGAAEGAASENSIMLQALRAWPFLPKEYNGLPTASSVNPGAVSPIASRDLSGYNNSSMFVFQSNLTLKWNIPSVKGLHAKALLSYDHDYTYSKHYRKPYKLMQTNLTDIHTTKPYTEVPFPNISRAALTEGMGRAARFTGQYSLNYANTFGLHDVTGLLLYEHSNRSYNQFNVTGIEQDIYGLEELGLMNRISDAQDAFGGSSTVSPRAGYVGRITYAYAQKYMLELSGRYDGSYKFARNKRWDFFPAVSLGWRLSNEPFFEQVSFVDNLKLRASYGKLGNDAGVAPYAFLNYVKFISEDPSVIMGDGAGKGQKALMTTALANPDMLWEVATTYNFGLESTLWHGLLGVELDLFYKVTSDILRRASGYPPSVLTSDIVPYVNDGIVDSRGFELTLSHNNRIGDFRYGIKGNLSWARSRIIRMDQSPNIPHWQKNNGRTVGQKEGFVALGLFKDEAEIAGSAVVTRYPTRPGDIKFKDLNGDGVITYDQDRTYIGKSNFPELMAGLNLTADWNGFDFSAFLQGGAMCDVALMGFYHGVGWDNTQFTRPFYGRGGNSPLYLMEGAWQGNNAETAIYPRLTLEPNNNGYASTFWLIDGSYVRLKSLQFGYTLPRKLTTAILGSEMVRFYLSGSNLFTWSHMPYLDPEAPDVNNGYYPQQKSYVFGLNITF